MWSQKSVKSHPAANKLVTVKGREIGLFNIKGQYYALANKCPHEGASLCAARWWALPISDGPGHSASHPPRRAPEMPVARLGIRRAHRPVLVRSDNTYERQYAVSVEPGSELLKGPYVVERRSRWRWKRITSSSRCERWPLPRSTLADRAISPRNARPPDAACLQRWPGVRSDAASASPC